MIADVAGCLNSAGGRGVPGDNVQDATAGLLIPSVANPLTARMGKGVNTTMDEGQTMIAQAVAATLTRGAESTRKGGYAGRRQEDDVNVIAIQERAVSENPNAGPQGKGYQEGVGYTLEARHNVQAVAFDSAQITSSENRSTVTDISPTMANGSRLHAISDWRVRRLTPTECERLQGFPDGYTDVPARDKNHTPDGPRYRALGNSMAVNCMRWIGRRIEMVNRDFC